MQIRSKSKTPTPPAPAPQVPQTQGVTQARCKPASARVKKAVPRPGDVVTISGKQEEFLGISFKDDHIRIDTVTDSSRGSGSKGTHSRFFYCQPFETVRAPRQQAATAQSGTGPDGTLPSVATARASNQANVSVARTNPGQQPEAPRTPHNTYNGSIGPQRTPRAPRKAPASANNRVRAEPAQSSTISPTERRIYNEQMRTVKHNKQISEPRAWNMALYRDAAHIQGFDAGPSFPSFLDQEGDQSASRPLGPCGTEYF